jgi:hypothetical protein
MKRSKLARKLGVRSIPQRLPQLKACECCGGFIKIPFYGRYPRLKEYARRRFCSLRCLGLHRKRAPIDRFRTKYQVAPSGCWQWTAGLFQRKNGNRDCRVCMRLRGRRWRQNNPEKCRQRGARNYWARKRLIAASTSSS